MKATIKTYQSGSGDCIFFQLGEEVKRYTIMIDCGDYSDEIKNHVENDLNNHIDLLVVTHIDADHILGVEAMLRQNPDLEIGRILFNCYQRDPEKDVAALTAAQKKRLEGIKSEIRSVCLDAVEHPISAKQATEGLASAILSAKKWSGIWDRRYLALDGKNEEPLGEWGIIKILAPTMKEIWTLDEDFKSLLFTELFSDTDEVEYDNSESLYEILIKYADMHASDEPIEHETAGEDLEQAMENAAKESAQESGIKLPNKASLAFVWEKGDKKVLFLGDAKPGIVIKGLLKHYPNGPYPMRFEAVKVAHHGSHYNTTDALMSMIDSEHFFITGGAEGMRPSEATLGRILLPELKCGIVQRTLHANYNTTLIERLKENTGLQAKYHFDVDLENNEHEFTI